VWKRDEGCPYYMDCLVGQRNWKFTVQRSRFVSCDVVARGRYKSYGLPVCDAVCFGRPVLTSVRGLLHPSSALTELGHSSEIAVTV